MDQQRDEIEIDWESFDDDYQGALGYHKRALQFKQEGQRYSLVFNVASVALERYLVALCTLNGIEPRNHNYVTLMIELQSTNIPFPKDLVKEIKSLDLIFGICSIEEFRHPDPDEKDAQRVLSMLDKIKPFFDDQKINSLRAEATQSIR